MNIQEIPSYKITYEKQIRISIIKQRCMNRSIPIHRHRYYEIVIITETKDDSHTHDIDFIEYPLQKGRIYFIYPNQTHKWNIKKYNNEYDGYIINFNEPFLLENSNNIKKILLKLFNPNCKPYLTFDPDRFSTLFPIMDVLKKEYHKENQNNSILRSLLETLLYYMEELKPESNQVIDSNFQKLITLKNFIEENYKKEKNAEFYSRKMDLSTKRLNEIVKKVSGFTITDLIHQRLMLEAKREIVTRNKTIQDIAYELGFETPSYFARFFKKYEKLSPKEYLLKC
jgi:AraC family transcriptional activator of pobA